MESHKSFKFIVQATPKDEGSLVHQTLIHEKLNVDVPDPNTMLQFAIDQTKDVDAHPTQVQLHNKIIACCILISTMCFVKQKFQSYNDFLVLWIIRSHLSIAFCNLLYHCIHEINNTFTFIYYQQLTHVLHKTYGKNCQMPFSGKNSSSLPPFPN